MRSDIAKISEFFRINKLTLNLSKTKCVHFGFKRKIKNEAEAIRLESSGTTVGRAVILGSAYTAHMLTYFGCDWSDFKAPFSTEKHISVHIFHAGSLTSQLRSCNMGSG